MQLGGDAFKWSSRGGSFFSGENQSAGRAEGHSLMELDGGDGRVIPVLRLARIGLHAILSEDVSKYALDYVVEVGNTISLAQLN